MVSPLARREQLAFVRYAAGSPTLMAWESLETTGPTSAMDRKPLIATHGFRVA